MIKRLFLLGLSVFTLSSVKATNYSDLIGANSNIIQTPVPFLNITPDSRAGAMGDAGVATSPDVNSIHWNPSKLAFIDQDFGVSLSYSPWLRKLVNDMNLAYLTGFYRIDKNQVIGASLRYFSLGEMIFTNTDGVYQGEHKPNEFAIDAAYSRLFGDNFSGGIAFRYIRSDLAGNQMVEGVVPTQPGQAFAADISAYYRKPMEMEDKNSLLTLGLNISNIGSKISYSESGDKEFIPTNLKLGGAYNIDIDAYNAFTVALDLNKLLVPTPDSTDKKDLAVAQGILQSFSDAPGGAKEEMHEIMYSIGAEYWYHKQFAIRAGYFHEHQTKGNRKYFTAGVGIKMNVFTADFSYLFPTAGRDNPLANTVRFTLGFNFDKAKKKKSKK